MSRAPDEIKEISDFLNKNTYLHLYAIGDLDERFNPYIRWHVRRSSAGISDRFPASLTAGITAGITAVVCVYTGGDSPTLMALNEPEEEAEMRTLLNDVIPLQPELFQAHLSPGLEAAFTGSCITESEHAHYKMALNPNRMPEDVKDRQSRQYTKVFRLTAADIPALQELYNSSYPGNWFEPDMLPINCYYGIFEGNDRAQKLLSAAGTHVFSPECRAAALGNICTHPDFRGRGFSSAVTAELCSALVSMGIRVGLNVRQDNQAAVQCYKHLGFSVCAEYGEFIFRRKLKPAGTDK